MVDIGAIIHIHFFIMEIKSVSENGIKFLINEEGIILHPYLDSANIPTIGVGNTYYADGTRVKMTDPPIEEEEAIMLFKNILRYFEMGVWSNTRDDINQNQFDALVSLAYNIGVPALKGSTVLKRVNANPLDPKITDAFKMWKNAGGKPILLKRRTREAKLYFS